MGNTLGTHWELDATEWELHGNTLETTKIQQPHPPPKGKKPGPHGVEHAASPHWLQEFFLPVFFAILKLRLLAGAWTMGVLFMVCVSHFVPPLLKMFMVPLAHTISFSKYNPWSIRGAVQGLRFITYLTPTSPTSPKVQK